MSADWSKVEQLFHEALKRAPAEREAFLRETCGGDEELRREVESLLAQEAEAERLMEQPAASAATQKLAVVRGTRLGPYEVTDLVGAGGMGEVYRARDARLGRDVAIKVLPEHVAHDPDALARFGREARAVAALSHPHIAAIFDVGETDGTHYLVMELLEGETLASRLGRGALPEKDALTRSGVKLLDFGAIAIGLPLLLGAAGIGLLYGRKLAEPPLPKITQLTFRRGLVDRARFTADGKTVVYSAVWDGNPPEIFTIRVESPESRSLGLPPARLMIVSSTSELAILLKAPGDLYLIEGLQP
jgi:hypothetical protein